MFVPFRLSDDASFCLVLSDCVPFRLNSAARVSSLRVPIRSVLWAWVRRRTLAWFFCGA